MHLLMRKGHPLLPTINKIIRQEAIQIVHLFKSYFVYAKLSKCDRAKKGPEVLGIVSYCGVLIVFGVGAMLAILVFVVELLLKRK